MIYIPSVSDNFDESEDHLVHQQLKSIVWTTVKLKARFSVLSLLKPKVVTYWPFQGDSGRKLNLKLNLNRMNYTERK